MNLVLVPTEYMNQEINQELSQLMMLILLPLYQQILYLNQLSRQQLLATQWLSVVIQNL